jgi:hypothetical protein
LLAITMLILGLAFAGPAWAQESTQPNLLLEMSRPAQPLPVDSLRDDILSRPAPPTADPTREPFRLYVGVGDPRCVPGEDGFMGDRVGRTSRRRAR